jgi:ABC-type antimicrobial peptide transport system permease subunit
MARLPRTALPRALGAPARLILRQAFVESMLLAVMGGVVGLLVAWAGALLLVRIAFRHAAGVPVKVSPSLAILSFCFAVLLIAGLIAGLFPAWLAAHTDPMVSMRHYPHRAWRDRCSELPLDTMSVKLLTEMRVWC